MMLPYNLTRFFQRFILWIEFSPIHGNMSWVIDEHDFFLLSIQMLNVKAIYHNRIWNNTHNTMQRSWTQWNIVGSEELIEHCSPPPHFACIISLQYWYLNIIIIIWYHYIGVSCFFMRPESMPITIIFVGNWFDFDNL